MFESVVESVRFYYAGILGYKVYSEVESVLNKYTTVISKRIDR